MKSLPSYHSPPPRIEAALFTHVTKVTWVEYRKLYSWFLQKILQVFYNNSKDSFLRFW